MNPDKYDYVFKVLLVGDSSVGKSTLLLKSTEDEFTQEFNSTIGVDFKIKYMSYKNKKVRLQIWDTAGQERFKTIVDSYYRDAHAVLICYDITDRESFVNLKNWINDIDNLCENNVYKIIVGLKMDLDTIRQVQYNDGENYTKNIGVDFIEISSKDLTIAELENNLYHDIVKKLIKKSVLFNKEKNDTVKINKNSGSKNIMKKMFGSLCSIL